MDKIDGFYHRIIVCGHNVRYGTIDMTWIVKTPAWRGYL